MSPFAYFFFLRLPASSLFSPAAGFCTWGGDARFWTAYSPLGPWHPGVAPPPPAAACDLSGEWQSLGGAGSPGNESLTLKQAAGSSNFTFSDATGSAAGWLDAATGYVTFLPSAGDGRGVVTSADGRAAGCDKIRWFGYESFIWCRKGADCGVLPSFADAPELNFCQNGALPVEGERLNPCDPGVPYGVNFTVPAQQFNVVSVATADAAGAADTTVLYNGERANSAPDRLFSHNFQARVALVFDAAGGIQPLTFPPSFELNLTNQTTAEMKW
jgi:hypothetical protein